MARFKVIAGLVTAASLVLTTAAQASVLTFTLDQDGCSDGCGTGPFGTITLKEFGVGDHAYVHVLETLAAGIRFAYTGAGPSLAFTIAEASRPISITDLTLGFHVEGSPVSASEFGVFSDAVQCNGPNKRNDPNPTPQSCQGGQVTNTAGPLSFNVRSAVGITAADFVANLGGYYFSSDIVGFNGKTGNVAALGGVTSGGCTGGDVGACGDEVEVPEPGSMWLMIMGLLGLGALAEVRKLRV